MNAIAKSTLGALAIAMLVTLGACGKEETPSTSPPAAQEAVPAAAAPTSTSATAAIGHDGPVIQLGEATIGSFAVVAVRTEAPIVAGGDSPVYLVVTPAPGSTATAQAVRFWVGAEDAKGSVRARAGLENPANPSVWHTHAEIPNPMPEGSRLWVEIEDDKGVTSIGSFDLKA